MLLVPCPICGPRAEIEFEYGGARQAASCKSWAKANIKGNQFEQWWHRYGCGQWFECERNTETHEFHGQSRLLAE